jgi:tRNA G18 (ribose-2'-O)-methylase SpoU
VHEFKTEKPICLIVGHEVSGVPQEILAESDAAVCIPMLGRKKSLM